MKYRGLCLPVWGPSFDVANRRIEQAVKLNANWVELVWHNYVSTAVPYAGEPIHATTNTASLDSVRHAVDLAHSLGLSVMLKPHVDWEQGGWRGYFYFKDDAVRDAWFAHYREMMRGVLSVADGVEAICIGCEFADINKDEHSAAGWLSVIGLLQDANYKGLLTYAANWGGFGDDAEFLRPGIVGVWRYLDFVGVDSYFPLSSKQRPGLAELRAGWTDVANPWYPEQHQNNIAQLQKLHEMTGKSIVMTEIGYPATDYAALNPGGEPQAGWAANEPLQADCYRAVFDTFSGIDWFDGVFFWQAGPVSNSHQILYRPAGAVVQARFGAQRGKT